MVFNKFFHNTLLVIKYKDFKFFKDPLKKQKQHFFDIIITKSYFFKDGKMKFLTSYSQ